MSKFNVGDRVIMPGTPYILDVLEIGECEEGDGCEFGPELFRFADPETSVNDWMHSSMFVKVAR
jgi:hypothetical protein